MSRDTGDQQFQAGSLAQLLAAAQRGESRARGNLLLLSQPRVLLYVRRHLPSALSRTIDAKDVVQDTFIEALRRLKTFEFRGEDSFHRWLVTIARTHMLQLLRAHRAIKRGSGRYASISFILEELAVDARTPSNAAKLHELAIYIETCIAGLPTEMADAVRLHHLERLTLNETAQRLGRTEGSIRMSCSRGMTQLREKLRSMSRFC